MYYSLIYPHLNYGVLLWRSTYKIHIERLLMLQTKAVIIISKADWNEHTAPIFKELNLFTIRVYVYLRPG